MPKHKLQLTYTVDEDGKEVITATHRTVVAMMGESVSYAEDVKLIDLDGIKSALREQVEHNRDRIEDAATPITLAHAASVIGKRSNAGPSTRRTGTHKKIVTGGAVGTTGPATPPTKKD